MHEDPPTYEEFRTGLTWTDVRRMLAAEQEAVRASEQGGNNHDGRAMHVRRNTVLGRFREIKQQMYEYELRERYGEGNGTEW